MSWLDDMLIHRVGLERVTGLNEYSDRTYGALATVAARVERVSAVTRDMDGEEVVVSHQVALLTACAVHDRITLPGGAVTLVRGLKSAEELDAGETLYIAEVS